MGAASDYSHVLYRFWDAADSLLYVGLTCDPGSRWSAHIGDKPWWTEVAKITLEHHPDLAAVQAAEHEAIRSENPRFNRSGTSKVLGPRRQGRAKLRTDAHDIAGVIRAEISADRFVSGEALPSSPSLAKRFDASVNMIWRAMKILEAEELVQTRRGSGTTVLDRQLLHIDTVPPSGTVFLLVVTGRPDIALITTEVVTSSAEPVPPIVTDALGPDVVQVHELTYYDGRPVEQASTYRTALAASPVLKVVDRVNPRPPTPDEVALLRCPSWVPVWRHIRTSFGSEGPVEVSLRVKPSHRYEIHRTVAA